MLQDQSHKTAIFRNKPSLPMRYLENNIYDHTISGISSRLNGKKNYLTPGNVGKYDLLDYGCGKGFDAEYYGMDKYDPYYSPEYPTKQYDLITCNYVLNVVNEKTEIDILDNIVRLLKQTGRAFISVRKDIPQHGKRMSGYMQRDSNPIANPFMQDSLEKVRFGFSIYHFVRGKYSIYQISKSKILAKLEVETKTSNRIQEYMGTGTGNSNFEFLQGTTSLITWGTSAIANPSAIIRVDNL